MSKRTPQDIRMTFLYVNHRGEERRVICIPSRFDFKKLLPWYPEETWLMRAYDLDRKDFREFQVSKMKEIEEILS